MKNENIRIAMIKKNLKMYQVAEMLGIRETSFSRKMRTEIPKAEQIEILNVINGKTTKENS